MFNVLFPPTIQLVWIDGLQDTIKSTTKGIRLEQQMFHYLPQNVQTQ